MAFGVHIERPLCLLSGRNCPPTQTDLHSKICRSYYTQWPWFTSKVSLYVLWLLDFSLPFCHCYINIVYEFHQIGVCKVVWARQSSQILAKRFHQITQSTMTWNCILGIRQVKGKSLDEKRGIFGNWVESENTTCQWDCGCTVWHVSKESITQAKTWNTDVMYADFHDC